MTAKISDEPVRHGPLFTPFTWYHDPSHPSRYDLAPATKDIAEGIQLALEIVEMSQLRETSDDQILGETDQGILMRFAITAARLLAQSADQTIEWSNEKYNVEQKARRGEGGE